MCGARCGWGHRGVWLSPSDASHPVLRQELRLLSLLGSGLGGVPVSCLLFPTLQVQTVLFCCAPEQKVPCREPSLDLGSARLTVCPSATDQHRLKLTL